MFRSGSIWFATLVTAIGGFLFGYDTAVINGANEYLKTHFALDKMEQVQMQEGKMEQGKMEKGKMKEGLVGASAILGCIPGAMFAGFLSDRFGRRKLLFLCAFLYAASGLLSAIPRTFEEFLAARFLSGLGIGASSMICPVYIAELAPEKLRGRLGSLFQLGIVTGIFVTLFINARIQGLGDQEWNTTTGWRWMLGAEVVPALVFFIALFTVPESPRWLIQAGREEEAREILAAVRGPAVAETEIAAVREVLGHEEGRFSELFTSAYRQPLVIAVLLMTFSQFSGINAIMYYSTKIFKTAGVGVEDSFTSSAWVGFVNLLATFVAIGLVDKAGRRPLLIVGLAIQVVALGSVGVLFAIDLLGSGLLGSIITFIFGLDLLGAGLLACIILFIAAFAMALGPIPWILCSEIFPARIRGRAMSLATFTIWTSCFIVAQTFPFLNDSPSIGPSFTFLIYAAFSLLGLAFVTARIPETKGRTLEEIEASWRKK